jgi:branched-chain amino acid transport system permease protein
MYWKAITFDKRIFAGIAAAAALLIVFPNLHFRMSDYVLSVMTQALLFIYLANSWNILSGLTGMFSMGHAAFFGVGAYACAIMTVQMDLPGLGLVPKYLLGILVGIICSALLSLIVAYIATKLKGLFFAMTTLAMAEVLRTFALQARITNGNIGIIIPPALSVGAKNSYYIILAMCALAFMFTWYLKHCRIGRMFISIRENENLAASLGVNITKWIYISVMISAVFASLGGAYYPLYLSHIEPTSTFDYAITMQMMIVCIAGGRGSVLGPVIGGVVILINEVIRSTLTKLSSGATSYASIAGLFYGLVLLMIVLFLSDGLISVPSRFRAWKKSREAKRREIAADAAGAQ